MFQTSSMCYLVLSRASALLVRLDRLDRLGSRELWGLRGERGVARRGVRAFNRDKGGQV